MEKKNTLLLTVIAVAVLLVAVVGATFAYFTATSTGSKTQTVKVTTNTINTSQFDSGSILTITANLNNFGKPGEEYTGSNPGTQSASNISHAKFKAGDAGSASMCYNVGLVIGQGKNTFETTSSGYSLSIPELSLTVKKGSTIIYDNLSLIGQVNKTIYFPTAKSTTAKTTPVQHKITSSGSLVDDVWTTTISLNWDSNGNQNDNAGKSFEGTIKFTKLDKCS